MEMHRDENRSFSVFGSRLRYSCRRPVDPPERHHIRHFSRGGHGSGLDELENVTETSECTPGFHNDSLSPNSQPAHCAIETKFSVRGHPERPVS